MNLNEPDTNLSNSIWTQIDEEFPSLVLPDTPTEEEEMAHAEREALRSTTFDSRYKEQRQAAIIADRSNLSVELKDEIEFWDATNPTIRKSGKVVILGEREAILRMWAENSLKAKQPVVPQTLTPRQFRLAMLSAGVTPDTVTSMLSDNPAALIEWEYASEIKRDHPLIGALAAQMGKSEAEIDQIFIMGDNL